MGNNVRALVGLGLGTPLLVLTLLGMMLVPLPPLLLDLLFTFNIALSLVVLLVAVYALRPLDFAVFPTLLLVATLLRLALNVASTRLVLLQGHTGPGAAGHVIEAFGAFVIGGNYAVGLVVFIILMIINFAVVTKGAGRVSEVNARFTLDAMPGKQMAIDADLSAGVITQQQAQVRREEVRQEADFYGAMDGASKFVRGDAVAGVLILIINILGGIAIGMGQHGMSAGDAVRVFSLLTIGDGLVAQVPSLLLSVAAAILVTRVSQSQNVATQVSKQLLANPTALAMAGGLVGILGVVPGMPHFAFLALGAGLGGAAWRIAKRQSTAVASPDAGAKALPAPDEHKELGWEEVAGVDLVGLEVGYRLIPLVDKAQGGELLTRIKGVRKKLSKELGFLLQPVHIRDNLDLPPGGYRITLMGATAGQGELLPDRDLAINPGHVTTPVPGIATKDPSFGLDALWIERGLREQAQMAGYTVVDPATVVATHLSQVLMHSAHELLGHEEVQQLLDRLAAQAPKLVENLTPKVLPLGTVLRVLRNLLQEGVPVRDLRSIAESLAEHGARSQDPDVLTALVRVAIGRGIVQELFGMAPELALMTLDPELERILLKAVQGGDGALGLEPGLAERLRGLLADAAQRQELLGQPAVLVAPNALRLWLARFVRHLAVDLKVLAYEELPENRQVRVVANIGGR
ncbi:flagellar biosynthesis protein FlhA [Immundisolibacter cernigliae]|uniref:Flagellar biosynthesis protein FlhA n=1 Tax=Immundisolibacter cernigliae TaxID=1810504 RepID=A0A1B1YQ95_9GAMM|nr:flagellar biosynthesis protein FlhA [Immundisolibacter cernigliae]